MIRKTLCILGAGLATVAMSLPASAATLIQSFEIDLNTPTRVELGGDAVSGEISGDAVGHTDGVKSYKVTAKEATNGAGAKALLKFDLLNNSAVLAALQANPVLQFDVTIPEDDDPSDAFTSTKAYVYSSSTQNGYDGAIFGSDGDFPFDGTTTTYTYTFGQDQVDRLANPANTWSQFLVGFNSQPGVQPTAYFDNFRIPDAVPEPTTLVLFGLGSTCLLIARNRRS